MELDQIESMFRSAWKQAYRYEPPKIQRILLITDKGPEKSAQILASVKTYLAVLTESDPQTELEWRLCNRETLPTVSELLADCEREAPDLIVTYRHLWNSEKDLRHSLGVYLDMLTQAVETPILVLPHLEDRNYREVLENTNEVMVVTDHLAEDPALVNYGVRLTSSGGKLFLAHVEHLHDFKRYMQVIGKIPELDTEVAEDKIANQLLKEPRDFIQACVAALQAASISIEVEPLVTFGHTVKTYRELLNRHQIDLLLLHSKDSEQLAMHGDAYSIAVEFTDIPLLLL